MTDRTGSTRVAALRSEEAEIRRKVEEEALIKAADIVRQKISASREAILSSLERIKDINEEQAVLQAAINDSESSGSRRSCSPARFRIGSTSKKKKENLLRLEELRSQQLREEESLEMAQRELNAAAGEENRVDFLLKENARRKVLLQRLATLQEGPEMTMSHSATTSPPLQVHHSSNCAEHSKPSNQAVKPHSPVVLRVKSVSKQCVPLDELSAAESLNSSTTLNLASESLSECEDIQIRNERFHEPERPISGCKMWGDTDTDTAEALISFQLSSDSCEDDVMSTLSCTEGIPSLTSTIDLSVTSTRKSTSPCWNLGHEFLYDSTLKSRKERGESYSYRSKGRGLVPLGSIVTSTTNEWMQGQQRFCQPGNSPVSQAASKFVNSLYERAMSAELENQALRRQIEALEMECNILRTGAISMKAGPANSSPHQVLSEPTRGITPVSGRDRTTRCIHQSWPTAPEEPRYSPLCSSISIQDFNDKNRSGIHYHTTPNHYHLSPASGGVKFEGNRPAVILSSEPAEPTHCPQSPSLTLSTGSAASSDGISSCSTVQNSWQYDNGILHHCDNDEQRASWWGASRLTVLEECHDTSTESKQEHPIIMEHTLVGHEGQQRLPQVSLKKQFFISPNTLEESLYTMHHNVDGRTDYHVLRDGYHECVEASLYVMV